MKLTPLPLARSPLALAAALLAAQGALAQTVIHVDAAAPAPGDGSVGAPYPTITQALADPRVGSVQVSLIEVAAGTYAETLLVTVNVFLQATEGPTVTILRPSGATDAVISTPDGPGRVGLGGFTIEGTGASVGIRVGDLSQGSLYDCVVRGHAIGADNGYDLRIQDCTFVDNGVSTVETLGPSQLLPATDMWNSILYNAGPDPSMYTTGAQNLIGVDPHFASYPGDVHLRSTSPAIPLDAGALPYDPNWPGQPTGCVGTLNSLVLRATLGATGSASLGAGDLVLHGENLPPHQFALLFHGTTSAAAPLGTSTLCAGGSVVRVGLQAVDPTGTLDVPFDGAAGPVAAPLLPGDSLHFQLWYRDVVPPDLFALSSSVRVTFAP